MFQNLPLPMAQEVHDSSCSLDSLHCHEEWWGSVTPSVIFSPEHWMKVVLQECAVVGSIYHLPWRYSVVQYYPINIIYHIEHHLHSRVHFLWTRRTGMLPFIWLVFQVWFKWTNPSFVHSDDSSKKVIFPLIPSNKTCATALECHCCTLEISWCSAISIQQGSKELNCVALHVRLSFMEVVLNGITAFSEYFIPLCHCMIWKCCIARCFMQSLKKFLCTMTSCHFSFDLGTLL